MKKILSILLLIPFLLTAQTIKKIETNYGVDREFYFYAGAVLDSGTVSSETFKLNQYDGNLTTYPISYELLLTEATADSSVITGVYIQAKTSLATWANVDTIFATDTLETSYSTRGVLDFGWSAYGAKPEYRIVTTTTSALGKKFSLKLSLYAYKQD